VNPYHIDKYNYERIEKCGGYKTIWDDLHYDLGPKHPFIGKNADNLKWRNHVLEEKRKSYKFAEPEEFKGFPPSIADFEDQMVKCQQGFTHQDRISFMGNIMSGIKDGFFYKILVTLTGGWKSNHYIVSPWFVYDAIFWSPYIGDKPEKANHWADDQVFSKMRLNGANPVVLSRCRQIPTNFQVDSTRVLKFLDVDVSLETAMSDGRIFIESYEDLENIPKREDSIVYPAMALHYVANNRTLVPIAIQLDQKITSDSLGVFYPDEGDAWLFAKIAVQNSYSLHHQVDTHLLKTHLNIEVWTIAMHRNILPDHPVFILLQNYLQKTMAINDRARKILLPKIIELVAGAGLNGSRAAVEIGYAKWNFTAAHLKNDLIARGVWDPTLPMEQQTLHGYDYRDFTLPLWDSLEDYAKGIIEIFYENDSDVLEDLSIQLFAEDVTIGGKMKGFPSPIRTKHDLVGVITMMMFTTSVQHAAVNYNQYEYFGYTPMSPLSLSSANAPKSKSSITLDSIFSMLPDFKKSTAQSATVWALTRAPFLKEEMLDHQLQWDLPRAQAVVDRFVHQLRDVTSWMERMNKHRKPVDKYTVLYPSNIPKATQI